MARPLTVWGTLRKSSFGRDQEPLGRLGGNACETSRWRCWGSVRSSGKEWGWRHRGWVAGVGVVHMAACSMPGAVLRISCVVTPGPLTLSVKSGLGLAGCLQEEVGNHATGATCPQECW